MSVIRCEECRELYEGAVDDRTEVFDLEVTSAGDAGTVYLPRLKYLCGACHRRAGSTHKRRNPQ